MASILISRSSFANSLRRSNKAIGLLSNSTTCRCTSSRSTCSKVIHGTNLWPIKNLSQLSTRMSRSASIFNVAVFASPLKRGKVVCREQLFKRLFHGHASSNANAKQNYLSKQLGLSQLKEARNFVLQPSHRHSFATSAAFSASGSRRKKRNTNFEFLPFEVDTNNVTEDILVYSNEGQTRFFFLVSLFGVIQFGFWVYLAQFAYSTLRDAPVDENTEKDLESLPFYRKVNLGGNKYRFGTTLLCAVLGYLLLFTSVIYPLRAVKYLKLLKGGRMAKFTTYGPFGVSRSFTAKVEHVQSMQSRAEMKSQISLKVKNRYMFYLLDSNGKFLSTQLFDFIVGLKRAW